jgi:hypothetical protein
LQVLDAVPRYEPEGTRVSALPADRLVLAPVRAVLLDADATTLVDLSLQCNVGSNDGLIFEADFGHLREIRRERKTCKKKIKGKFYILFFVSRGFFMKGMLTITV